MCGNIACAVDTIEDEGEIPMIWRADELSKLQGPKAKHPGRQQQENAKKRPLQGNLGENVGESCIVEYDDECDDRDYCVPEDESATAKGDYVSLVDNPERFTGYSGDGPHMVWDAIYKENCFSKPSESLSSTSSSSTPGSAGRGLFKAASDLRSVIRANSNETSFTLDDTCIEKRVFYRIISGMHASISTHLCYDYLDQRTGAWGPNLTCYTDRLGNHPERVSNLYFNYALVLRAVAKLRTYLRDYSFCTWDPVADAETKQKVVQLVNAAANSPPIFDESIMFQDPASGIDLKEDFRMRFRNVSRLMDCVGCDKCRLWGKLQTAGYGTALKVLFEFEEGVDLDLKRTELVALVNTLDRIGASISALAHFRRMALPSDGVVDRPLASSPAVVVEDEDEDFEEWQAARENRSKQPSSVYEDFKQSFESEFGLVYKTTLYVFKEWFGLPKKVGHMAIYELSRVWAVWLGLPAPNIVYSWARPPTRDEL